MPIYLPQVSLFDSDRQIVTTAGTRVRLKATTTPCSRIDITAEIDNTGVVVVGTSDVVADAATRKGIPLRAGAFYSIDVEDAYSIYIDSTVNGDGVTYNLYR